MKKRKDMAGHLRVFTSRSLKELLMIHNFIDIRLYGARIEYAPSIVFKLLRLFDYPSLIFPSLSMHNIIFARKP